MRWIGEVAHQLGIVPLVWLALLQIKHQKRGTAFWVLAGAYGVSWIADSLSHIVDPWLASVVYPVSQASLIGAVLLDRDDAMTFTMVLLAAGMASVVLFGIEGPDVLLRSTAWLGVAGIAARYKAIGRVRWALFVSFGAGWVAWVGYALAPGWTTWLLLQSTRVVGTGLLCWSAAFPRPAFKLSRPRVAYDEWNPILRS